MAPFKSFRFVWTVVENLFLFAAMKRWTDQYIHDTHVEKLEHADCMYHKNQNTLTPEIIYNN